MKEYLVRYYEGSIPQYFVCQADDAWHAVEQCRNAYPEAGITGVSYLKWLVPQLTEN